MRNLKKILALVLALVMSLSLMATASATDFKDDDKFTETYKVAAQVLEGLGVLKGDPDGSFRPDGSITRAEAAAAVYRIVTGDVEDKQVGIYADYNIFSDVQPGDWYAGYVNFCANAEYIKGNGDGTFTPNAKVTGYAALAMILRAIGYTANGGFTGPDWEVQTARTAEARKITKNILTGMLGQDASREMVAEILFQAILVNMVGHNVDYAQNGQQGYYELDETLGYKTFKLEEIEGVVVANEWANLNGAYVLGSNKTDLQVAGEDTTRRLAIGTEITDIGESRYVYTQNVSKVLAMGDTGKNTVTGTDGAACDISSAGKFNAVAGMPAASDIEYYVNFDRTGHYDCDQRLEFVVKFELKAGITYKPNSNTQTYATLAQIVEDFEARYVEGQDLRTDVGMTVVAGSESAGSTTVTYSKIIRAKDEITQDDMNVIKGIFYAADNNANPTSLYQGVEGDVYVGTRSGKSGDTDWSDELSYAAWTDRFINDVSYDINWNTSVNGDWVKFVDNDGDGAAEYAFKTHYNLEEALYTYTTKDGDVVMEFNTFDDENYDVRYLDDYAPSVGDKVLAALIDGQWLVEPANSEHVIVSSYSWRNDEVTTDKGVYGQSGIENETNMLEEIKAMEDKVEYIVYFDHFGYIRAYELPGGVKYALLTELYYTNGDQGNLIQNWPMTVEMTTLDDEGKKVTGNYNVASGSGTFLAATEPWMRVNNVVATYQYNNWLQPAIAHLGVTYKNNVVDYTAHKGTPDFNSADQSFWPANRQVVRGINTDGMNGLEEFNWGAESFIGAKALNSSKGHTFNQPATASFTNVAVVGIEGNNATLAGAAQLALDKDGTVKAYPDTYARDYIQLSTADVAAKAVRYDIFDDGNGYKATNNNWVNAVHDTLYFIAYNGGVYAFEDFVNFPGLNMKDNKIHAAYAVARNTASDNADYPYWVADVIVYEVYQLSDTVTKGSVSLAFYTPTRTSGNVQEIDTLNSKYGPEVTLVPGGREWNVPALQWGNNWESYGFYRLWNETEAVDGVMSADDIKIITKNYNDNGIYAGTIVREAYIDRGGQYIDVALDEAQTKIASIEITNKIYSISSNFANYPVNVANALRYENQANSQVLKGDKVIWVGEAKTNGTKSSTNFVVDLGSTTPTNIYAGDNILGATPEWLIDYTELSNGTYTIAPVATGTGEWQKIMKEQGVTPTTDNITISFEATSADPNFPGKSIDADSILKGSAITYTMGDQAGAQAKFNLDGWEITTVTSVYTDGSGTAGTVTSPAVPGTSNASVALTGAQTTKNIKITVTYAPVTVSLTVTATDNDSDAAYTWAGSAINVAINGTAAGTAASMTATPAYGDTVTLTWTGEKNITFTTSAITALNTTAGAALTGAALTPTSGQNYSLSFKVVGAGAITITTGAVTPITVTGMTDTAVTAWTTGTSNATTAATYYAGDKLTNVEPTVVAANYDVTGMYWTDDNGTTKHAMTKDAATGKWSSADEIGTKAVAVYAQTVSKNVTVTVAVDATTVGAGKTLVAFSVDGANAAGTAQNATAAGTLSIARGSDLTVKSTTPAGAPVWVLITGTVANPGTNGYNSVTIGGISDDITVTLYGTEADYNAAVAALG